jgi:hypothetical protein
MVGAKLEADGFLEKWNDECGVVKRDAACAVPDARLRLIAWIPQLTHLINFSHRLRILAW